MVKAETITSDRDSTVRRCSTGDGDEETVVGTAVETGVDGCESASDARVTGRKRKGSGVRGRAATASAWRTRGARVSEADVRRVQTLLERCLRLYMSKEEIVRDLDVHANVDAAFTHLVWDRVERSNPAFFEAYGVAVKFKDQVIRYNAMVNRYKEQKEKDPKAFEEMEAEAERLAEEEEGRAKAAAARVAEEKGEAKEKAQTARRALDEEEEEERERERAAAMEQHSPETTAVLTTDTTTTTMATSTTTLPLHFRASLHGSSTESPFKPVPELKEEVLRALSVPGLEPSSCDEKSPTLALNAQDFTLHEVLGFAIPPLNGCA